MRELFDPAGGSTRGVLLGSATLSVDRKFCLLLCLRHVDGRRSDGGITPELPSEILKNIFSFLHIPVFRHIEML